MKKKGSGKYLFKYYKKELDLFFEHLDKAKYYPDVKNIHQLRVDIKHIRTVFQFIEMLFPKKLKAKNHFAMFKNIFRSAGKVREAQVNHLSFMQYKLPSSINKHYFEFLKRKEKKFKKKFNNSIDRFEIGPLEKSKNKIRKLCNSITEKKIINKCQLFIKGEIHKIEILLAVGNSSSIAHKIRIHLKAIEAVGDLHYRMNPDKEFEKLLSVIKKNGTLIGNWHDKLMLISSLEIFFTNTANLKGNKLFLLKELLNKIDKENQLFLKSFRGKTKSLLKRVKGFI